MGIETKSASDEAGSVKSASSASEIRRGGAGSGVGNMPQPAVVGIGASAGGLTALKALLASVPEDSGVAYVIVVHLSPEHDSHLAELLRPHVRIPIEQVTDQVPLEANRAYIIPPGRNLNTIDSHLRLSPLEEKRSKRAPVDHFLRTLASSHNGNSVGIILTGTGSDGALGIQEIKGSGGFTVVQDPNEAEYDGMPRSAFATGAVDLVLPLDRIIERTLQFLRTQPLVPVDECDEEGPTDREPALQKILALVRARSERDFIHYKQSTIMRRIRRRMQLAQTVELSGYLDYLQEHAEEITALADDFLITVTSFFRDREVFESLEREVIPQLFKEKGEGAPVRVWSVGCATGEEAYSLAMLLIESAERYTRPPLIQVFASDLHEKSLKRAREGLYPGDIETDVSPERLQRFFRHDNGVYRIRKEVRDLVVFAPHNLLIDPPFSKVDLILCRNVLIYLQRNLQPNIIELFHYALNNDGWLVLGTAESIGNSDLFFTENKTLGIYRKRNLPRPEPRLSGFPFTQHAATNQPSQVQAGTFVSFGALHHRMVERYAPPSILVSTDNKIVHLSEQAGRYLQQPGGVPTTSVFKVVRDELQVELLAGLECAQEQGEPYASKPISLTIDGAVREVVVQTRPGAQDEGETYVLVIFDERPQHQPETVDASTEVWSGAAPRELQTELVLTKRRLQSAIDEYETSQEEMRAANEELQSANEELRSTLEELETSKEELQSINEELQTANQANSQKVAELSQLSDDLQHLMAATHIATLFLDRKLRILRFTPQIGDLFSLRTADRGRPLSDLTHRLHYDELIDDATLILTNLVPIEREIQDASGRWYLARMRPYRTSEDVINGVVLTFVDITARKRSEQALRKSEERYRILFDSMDEGFCVVEEVKRNKGELDFRVTETNRAFMEQTGLTDAEGRLLSELVPQHLDFWVDVYERLEEDGQLARFECEEQIFERWFEVYAFRLPAAHGPHVAVLFKDIAQQKRAEAALRDAVWRDAFRLTLADALRSSPDPKEIQTLGCRLLARQLSVDTVTYDLVSNRHEGASSEGPAQGFMPWQQNPLLLEQLSAGQTLVMDDTHPLQTLTTKQRALCQNQGLRALVSVPQLKGGQLISVFSVHHSQSRRWSEAEISLIEEVADRTWAAAERARAEQAVRQREAALREADSRKDEFLAVLSHELRNPLAPITNSLQILENVAPGGAQASDAQATIKRQVELLARLVDDLLDLTRVARGKVQLVGARLDLNELLERTVEDHRSLFKKVGVGLELENLPDPVWVHGDANRLAQAIGNLLLNCAKFTGRGGHTRVSLGVEAERQRAVVRVADSGAGMSSDVLSQLFQPFVQGEATLDRSKGGLGLGLALTKRLIELHGGDIRADSAGLNKGSVFTIRLSIDESQPADDTQEGALSPVTPCRVLIIEDNIDAAKTLGEVLQFSDHQIAIAFDGAEGVALARKFRPDVVLCDIGLPGMDGYEVARTFRADEALRQACLVALSGYAMPEDCQRALNAGFDKHLAKPPDLKALERIFAEMVCSPDKNASQE